MKILRFNYLGKTAYGVLKENKIIPIKGDIYENFTLEEDTLSLNQVKVLNPVNPGKTIAVGLNYLDHAKEFNFSVPEEPIIFLVASTAIIGPNEPVILPDVKGRVDYEGELVIVIGKRCFNVDEAEAINFVLGYTCGNDISNRRLQKKDGQWTRAKSFNTFKPLGPWIATDLNAQNLEIKTLVNGEIKQHSNTNNFVFSIPKLISFISKIMPLEPGDIIYTGTPAGVGPIKKGDDVEVIIEGIGSLKNTII